VAQLFNRQVRLTIGKEPPTGDFKAQPPTALVLTGLRVVFKVEKSIRPEPQKCEITVYNLSQKSRGQLAGKSLKVVLEAGYENSIAVIYSGHTRTIDHEKQRVDWLSKFECGTNEREISLGRMSASFKPGAKVGDLVKQAVNVLVTDPGNALSKINGMTQTFSSGYAAHGYAAEELTRVLSPMGLAWSIQDGRMQIIGLTETVGGAAIQLDPDHGLIGTPELGAPPTKGGPSLLKIKSLLQARFVPGGKVQLNSAARKGIFKIVKLTHEGDTDSGPWFTELECLPI
jgi:hypothetical protein